MPIRRKCRAAGRDMAQPTGGARIGAILAIAPRACHPLYCPQLVYHLLGSREHDRYG